MAEERVQGRLAAILVAYLVGYSRVMEADEVGTRSRLRSPTRALTPTESWRGNATTLKNITAFIVLLAAIATPVTAREDVGGAS